MGRSWAAEFAFKLFSISQNFTGVILVLSRRGCNGFSVSSHSAGKWLTLIRARQQKLVIVDQRNQGASTAALSSESMVTASVLFVLVGKIRQDLCSPGASGFDFELTAEGKRAFFHPA